MNATAQLIKQSDPHPSNPHHLNPHNFSKFTLHALFDEARLLMGQERTLQYRLAAVLRELDARAHHDGKPTRLPQWLHHNFGITFGAAREKVRTARALGTLPLINAAFRDGELSYSKVRALTRAATAENEEQLLTLCRGSDAEGVERVVRQVKQQACLDDVQALIRSRSLSTRWDETGALVVQDRLTPGDRHQVHVHVSAETLADTNTDKNNVPAETLHPETIRRLACDGGLVTIIVLGLL